MGGAVSVLAIVQARMGSTRFPGKVLEPLGKDTMLWHVVTRTMRANINELVVATTDTPEDDPLADYCRQHQWHCVRGPALDVLARYVKAAVAYPGHETILRVTADCPLIDPGVINGVLDLRERERADYACNNLKRSFPHGLDCEAFTRESLLYSCRHAETEYDREHVTEYMRTVPREFSSANLEAPVDLSWLRLTVDYPRDLDFIRKLLLAYPSKPHVTTADVLWLLERRPDLLAEARRIAGFFSDSDGEA